MCCKIDSSAAPERHLHGDAREHCQRFTMRLKGVQNAQHGGKLRSAGSRAASRGRRKRWCRSLQLIELTAFGAPSPRSGIEPGHTLTHAVAHARTMEARHVGERRDVDREAAPSQVHRKVRMKHRCILAVCGALEVCGHMTSAPSPLRWDWHIWQIMVALMPPLSAFLVPSSLHCLICPVPVSTQSQQASCCVRCALSST